MADADNHENERIMNAAQYLRKSSISDSPAPDIFTYTACKESASDISNTSLSKIQKVAQQLVMNSPDRQQSLIKSHLRSSAPPCEYDSPDSCPPPPNNTPDSSLSNSTSNRGSTSSAHTPYSTVKVLKHSEKSANWTVSPITIPENTPVGKHELVPAISSSRWTVTPASVVSSPGNISDCITSDTSWTPLQNTTDNSPKSEPSRIPSNRFSTPGNALGNKAPNPGNTPSRITSPIPNIVVTPPVEEYSLSNSYIVSTPDESNISLQVPRLRSDSEGSVSSILSLNSAMLKLINSSHESNDSSIEGLKDTDDQPDLSSDNESPTSVTSKSSCNQSLKDDCGKKKTKDLRKKLLKDLMSAEVTKREEESLKKYNIKLTESLSPKHNQESPHVSYPLQHTNGSLRCKVIALIICMGMASLLVTWLFTDLIRPLQKLVLVDNYDSVEASKEPHRLPWFPENEEMGNTYKYGGVRDVLTKMTYTNIGSDNPVSPFHNDNDEKESSINDHDFNKLEETDLDVLDHDTEFNDLHSLEETNDNLEIVLDDDDDEIENESNDMIEPSDPDELDDGMQFDESVIENMKPTILKHLYYNILKCHVKGDVNIIRYTNMYRYLNSFLTTFGSFAATQSKMLNDRIDTLEKLKEHNVNYTFASSMFKYEVESGLIDDEFPISGSMIFNCLHRHLQYLQEALENIIYIKPRQSLYVAFKAAYDDILAEYHHWFVEKFYLLGLSTLPTKADALQRLNERFVETSSMVQLSIGLKLVSEQLQELTQVTEVLLNKYNVTQRIPAQVIT